MRTIPLALWNPSITSSGIFEGEIDGEQVRIEVKGVRIDGASETVLLYEAGDEFPTVEQPPAPPQWLLLYSQLLMSNVFQVVRLAIATGTDNALGACYSDLGFSLQNGAALEAIQPGAGLGPFQVAIANLTALVPLTDELLLELRALLDANGFGAIASPLPPPPPEPEPEPAPEP